MMQNITNIELPVLLESSYKENGGDIQKNDS